MAGLLSYIKHQHINNIVWLTADVHYAAAHYTTQARPKLRIFHHFGNS